jgi:UDP-N-acetylglucosamine 2-epimerase (non-hydrolysing)
MPLKIIVVVGARPNFIKVAPLMPALLGAGYDAALVHTGQHYDSAMSDVFFSDLDIPEPRWSLNVGSGPHAVQTGTAMMALERLFQSELPDAVMVVGDVNSTLAGALAASKLQIPVIHLEAGLRSYDMLMPEEVNRLVADQLASMHLAPTREAVDNLLREGIEPERIHFVGNIMAESVLRNLPRISKRSASQRFGFGAGEFVLATVHRPENTDRADHLQAIMSALTRVGLPVLFPAHPRTRPALEGLVGAHESIALVDPVGYVDMLSLQKDAAFVVTDSGGVQEESCMLKTPCVTVRRSTERAITVDIGANRLVPPDEKEILHATLEAARSSRFPCRWGSGDPRGLGRATVRSRASNPP